MTLRFVYGKKFAFVGEAPHSTVVPRRGEIVVLPPHWVDTPLDPQPGKDLPKSRRLTVQDIEYVAG